MIQIKCTGSDELSLGEIKEFQGGLKNRSEKDIDKIILSIRKYGFSFPFFIWKKGKVNYCLDGHGRIKALERLMAGGEELPRFPVVYIQAKDAAEAKNKLLRVNSQYGQMTMESVLEFSEGIELNIDEIQLPSGVLDILSVKEETVGDDEAPETQTEVFSKIGEIYQLGEHRLMCGDSTKDEDVERLMDGNTSKLLITSPPYSDARDYGGNDLSTKTLAKFIPVWRDYAEILAVNLGVIRKNNEIVEYWQDHIKAAHDSGLKMLSWNVWDRNQPWSMAQNTAMFPLEHEFIFVFGEHRIDLNLTVKNKTPGNRTGITNRQKDGSLKSSSPKQVRKYRPLGSIFRSPPHIGKNIGHPAMYPVALPSAYIEAVTEKGDNVSDSFMGSGTTIIAAEQIGRVCYGMELDPVYCDVIRRRWTKWARENGKDAGSGYLEPIEKQ